MVPFGVTWFGFAWLEFDFPFFFLSLCDGRGHGCGTMKTAQGAKIIWILSDVMMFTMP